MVDKIIEMDFIASQKLAEEMEEVYLDLGITTLNGQLPYFLDLMQKYRLNYNNPYHLKMIRDSLEARLNSAENNLTKELAVLDSGQPLSMLPELNLGEFYLKECERVKNELIIIYKEYANLGINDFKSQLLMREGEDCYIELILKSNILVVRYADRREEVSDKIWSSDKCIHSLFDIQVMPDYNVKAKACKHIDDGTFKDYSDIAKKCFEFYMEKTNDPQEAERFSFYFEMLRNIPGEIITFANPSVRREIQETNKKYIKDVRDKIINMYLGNPHSTLGD